MSIRTLLVEDEKRLAESIRKGFEENGYVLRHAYSLKEARGELSKSNYDVIILDLMLVDEDGLLLCKELRESGNAIPILILSARDQIEDKLNGFELGANDYLTKPFAFPELLARIRVLARHRTQPLQESSILEYAGVTLDLNHRTAARDGKDLGLTNKEFSLLELFIRNPGRLINRVSLSEKIWDRNADMLNTNVIDVYINYLRKKLKADDKPELIKTIRGAGYVFEE